jgi:hypothetical protein
VEGEIYCYVAMFPNDDRWSNRNPLLAYNAGQTRTHYIITRQ